MAPLPQKHVTLTTILARLGLPISRVGGSLIAGSILVSAALTVMTRGFSALGQFNTWRGFSYLYKHPIPSVIVLVVVLCLIA